MLPVWPSHWSSPCLRPFLWKNKRISTPPTSQQKLKSAKALWKVLCIPKVSFTRQNPPKKRDSLKSALLPRVDKEMDRKWSWSFTYLWPFGPKHSQRKKCFATSRTIHKGKRQMPLFPVFLHSPSSMFIQVKCIYLVDIYGTSIMHPAFCQVLERDH